jgi:hypothetical protein
LLRHYVSIFTLISRRGAERLDDAYAQRFGRGERGEAFAEEAAKAAVDRDAGLAVRTVAQVDLEGLPFLIAEGTIEEEVDHSFHIVTEHRCDFLPWA